MKSTTIKLDAKIWCSDCPLFHSDSEEGAQCYWQGTDGPVFPTYSEPRPKACKVTSVTVREKS